MTDEKYSSIWSADYLIECNNDTHPVYKLLKLLINSDVDYAIRYFLCIYNNNFPITLLLNRELDLAHYFSKNLLKQYDIKTRFIIYNNDYGNNKYYIWYLVRKTTNLSLFKYILYDGAVNVYDNIIIYDIKNFTFMRKKYNISYESYTRHYSGFDKVLYKFKKDTIYDRSLRCAWINACIIYNL